MSRFEGGTVRLSPDHIKRILIAITVFVTSLTLVIAALVVITAQGAPSRPLSIEPAEAVGPSQAAFGVAPSWSRPTGPVSPHGASIDAFQGLGTWVDLWDARAWRDPEAAVADMARHGVRTLFLQSGNYSQHDQLFKEAKLKEFISAGHAREIKVVAWYLPNMKTRSVDYIRIMRAIDLRTADGQAFDGFALDIESTAISSEAMRNRRLEALSAKIREGAGPHYPLGAIIPAPAAIRHENSMWNNFPYTMLTRYYDVFMPMGYYTYDGYTASAALSDVRANLATLRAQRNCRDFPIHLIGGEAENSSDDETRAFVRGVVAGKVLGASIYTWDGTAPGAWKALSAIKP
jgi:hypothetical protein